MNKILLSIVFLCLILTKVSGYENRNFLSANQSPEKIGNTLALNQKWVQYPSYADREGWDSIMGKNKTTTINRGVAKLKYEWRVIKATDYLEYERTGNRFTMQNINSANNIALVDLVLAELAEGKGRFLDQIANGVFYLSERTSWVLSAHLHRQKSKRSMPNETDQIIDLGSAETGAILSWTYYFFNKEFDKIDPVLSQRLKFEIYKKIIIPYRTDDSMFWMALNASPTELVNNWNPWNNSNVLQCIMLLENDSVQLSKDVYRSMISVDKFMNYISSDGACEEGPSYWEHAAGKLYDYLQFLHWISGGKISLFNSKMVKDMGEYISRSYIGNEWVVNFADASAKLSTNGNFIYRYGKAVSSAEMMHFGAQLAQKSQNSIAYGTDLFRVLESLKYDAEIRSSKAEHAIPDYTIYSETQFYYFKSKQNFFLAAKGGFNAVSHNHNDAGSFALWVNEQPVIIDAGVGTYTRQTFGPERYTIWTMRSKYHNLPTINGSEQSYGRSYKVTDVKVDGKKRSLSMNLAQAYPSDAQVQNWTRTYNLTDKGLIIIDKYSLIKAVQANEINFLLWGKVEVQNNRVLITVKNEQLELSFDKNQFTPNLETVSLTDTKLSNVWGKEVYRLTLTAKVLIENGEYKFIIRKL